MNRKSGFSLLEVLAALLVTSLLVVAFTPLVHQMLMTWARGADIAGLVEFRVRGLGTFRDDLRHAVVWTGFGKAENLLAFRGNETSMTFPAVSSLGEGEQGLEMIWIEVTNSIDGHAVVRRRAPLLGSTYGTFVDPVVIFSGPFKYVFGYSAAGSGERPVWNDLLTPPARVVLKVEDGSGRLVTTPIDLPIAASLSTACLLNALLPGCAVFPPPTATDDDPLVSLAKQLGQ